MQVGDNPSVSIAQPFGDANTASPIVDGFTYTLSRIPQSQSWYWASVSQMENLRRANAYHSRIYNVPDDLDEPIPAYGTLEYQVRTQPGAYLWAFMFSMTGTGAFSGQLSSSVLFEVTDACTESKLFSDFTLGSAMAESQVGLSRCPCVLSQPYLVGPPALLNVEISNRLGVSAYCQLLLYFAEPSLPVGELDRIFRNAGYR